MQNIRGDFIQNIEETTGIGIRYASIRPYFFGNFEIRNLRFYKDGRSFLSVSKASVRFSLYKLLSQDKSAIHTVFLERPVLRMDLQRDRDLFDTFFVNRENRQETETEIETEKVLLQKIAEFLPKNINYKIKDASFLFINNDYTYQFDGVTVDIRGDKNNILFDSAFNAEIRYSGFSDKVIVINTLIDIKSIGDLELNRLNTDILFSSINCSEQKTVRGYTSFLNPISTNERTSLTPLFTIRPFNVNLSYEDRIIYVDQKPDHGQIDYSFRYNFASKIMTAHYNMDNYNPGINFSFQDSLYKADHLLDMPITGNFWFLKNETGAVNYSVNYTAGDNTDGFIVNATGNLDHLVINEFSVFASEKSLKAGLIQGDINVKGDMQLLPLRPNLELSFEGFTMTGTEEINASLELTNNENEINLTSNYLKAGNAGIEEFSVKINPSEENIFILATMLCQDKSAAFVDAVFTRTSGQFDTIFTVESFSLYNIAEIMRPFVRMISFPDFIYGFINKNRLDAQVFISSDTKNIIYNVPNIVIKNDSVFAEMSVSGTDRQFNLSHGIVYFEDEMLLIKADAMVNNFMDINFNVNASYQDVTWNIEGELLDGQTLIIRDPNGFHAYGIINNMSEISGYIEGINYPVPVNSNLLYLNFYINLRYFSNEFWSLDVSYFEAHDINSIDGRLALKISGSADQDGAHFREIVFNDDIGMLFGNADFAWDPDFSYLQFFVSMTDGYHDGENYSFEGMFKNKQVNMVSSISNMHLNRFFKGSKPMLASADAVININSINDFIIDMSVSSFYAGIRDDAIEASGGILITNNNIFINDVKVEFQDLYVALPLVQINRADGKAEIETNIKGMLQQKDFEIIANLNADFDRMDNRFDITQALTDFNASLNFSKFHYGDFLHNDVEFNFSGVNGAISIHGGVDESFGLEMDNIGNFYMSLSSPLPIRGSIAGTLNENFYLDAHCNYFFIDLKTIWDLASLKDNVFYFDGGYITGKIDIRGPVWNPEFFGTGKGTSLNIQVPDFIAGDIKPVPFNVVAQGYEMTFGPAFTVCGTGGGTVEGWLRFEYWSPKNTGLDIKINNSTPIPYKIDIAGVTSEGDVSGNLSLNYYDADKLVEISADLFMNNSEMGLNMWEFSLNEESYDNNQNHSIVDIKITTGPMIEFFWPNRTNPIIRVNPEMGTVFYLTSDTQARQYSLVSDINIRAGELNYLDRNFFIRQGVLTLNEDEREFNPVISARAEVRDRIDSGPVTIYLIVDNQPLLNFEPHFETNPGITQLELYTLLGQNYAIQDPDDPEGFQRFLVSSTTDLITQVVARSDTLGQLIFLRQLERQARDFLNLDMLNIRTKLLQNTIASGVSTFGGRNTMANTETVDRTSRVGNYLDNTTVSIGKYIGQDMFALGSVTMKYDENNPDFGGIKFEWDIGIEWQSPFVNIRWNFLPATPQNWWVNDNSITVSWSKSF